MNHTASALLAVLPFFGLPQSYQLGPLPIHPFGLLVATGIIIGHQLAMKRALVLGLDVEKFEKLVFWTVLTGIVLSHMLDDIFYHWDVLRENPLELFMIHHGLSSFGGFFGAGIGFFVYSRTHKVDVWRSADAIAFGLPVGWLFGRMGCTVVHDHPGHASNSMFAMHFAARPQFHLPVGNYFDLGLLELLCTPFVIAVVFLVASRTKKPGSLIAVLTLLYPIIRFPLDNLRMPDPNGGDVRFLGFTPGQYACVLCFCIGLYILKRTWSLPADEPKPVDAGKKPKSGKKGQGAAAAAS